MAPSTRRRRAALVGGIITTTAVLETTKIGLHLGAHTMGLHPGEEVEVEMTGLTWRRIHRGQLTRRITREQEVEVGADREAGDREVCPAALGCDRSI